MSEPKEDIVEDPVGSQEDDTESEVEEILPGIVNSSSEGQIDQIVEVKEEATDK